MHTEENRRNRPADQGRNNDPGLRDYTGQQPGMNTISSSATDDANHRLSETAKDGFNEDMPDPRADRNLDETVDDDDDSNRIY